MSFALKNQSIYQQPIVTPPNRPIVNPSTPQVQPAKPVKPEIKKPVVIPQKPQKIAQGVDTVTNLKKEAELVKNQQQLSDFLYNFKVAVYDPKDKAQLVAILQNLAEAVDLQRLPSGAIDSELIQLGAVRKIGLSDLEQSILQGYQTIEKEFNSTEANVLVKEIEKYIISGGEKNFSGRLEKIQQLLRLDALSLRIERLIKSGTNIATAFSSAQYGNITFNAISKEDKKYKPQ